MKIRPSAQGLALLLCLGTTGLALSPVPAVNHAAALRKYNEQIKPLLENYCYDCHGDGASKGKVAFDRFASDSAVLEHPELWYAVLKNVRAGLMPADKGPRPTDAEIELLANWVKYDALGLDPTQPDPGRVVLRRLNRVEYGNTIRDLMGVEFDSQTEFPPDDTGHGFDNLGEVLTVSPLLLEKYLQAAEEIVNKAVPRISRVPALAKVPDTQFKSAALGDAAPAGTDKDGKPILNARPGGKAFHPFSVTQPGTYRLALEVPIRSTFDFDTSRATLVIFVDGQEKQRQEIFWGAKTVRFDEKLTWAAGDHQVTVELQPILPQLPNPVDMPFPGDAAAAAAPAADALTPGGAAPAPARRPPAERSVTIRLTAQLEGPLEEKYWVPPDNYRRFFPDDPPVGNAARDKYARKVLGDFAQRAFRRPVDKSRVDQLVSLAHGVYTEPNGRFEDGIARAMMAVLASPRFLFRLEEPPPGKNHAPFLPVDEYALATRLSYFLWSSMPDEELTRLASRGELRAALPAQVARMLKDPKSQAFVKNFPGQWLQARDIESVPINARAVLGLTDRGGNRALRGLDLDSELRRAMRSETEMTFEYVLREDRSVLEFVESNYTFLNARLAKQYGIPGVEGDKMRRVTLPEDSPRGGVLTQGTVLAVTSNPTRTSPVKRGLFVLDNILGIPPPPPPPDIPALEESVKSADGHDLTLREALAKHRENVLCASCHARMDPLGFALENFNALGNWRTLDAKQPIDAAGVLVTGEKFQDIRDLKKIITHERRLDYYRCLTEKLLMYALGRGLDYRDVETVDQIVAHLERDQGKFSTLLTGIINSSAFQKQRQPAEVVQAESLSPLAASSVPSAHE